MEVQDISMGFGERTVLTKANDKSYSLRATVPKGIVSHLDLKEGDYIRWVLKPSGKRFRVEVIPEKSKKVKK